jgi:glutamyl/glutaminyl-tRNA synthetase
MNPPTFSRTRIAPTPSGFLHLGNILSFSITAAMARKTGARILLRIDDLDRERTEKKYVEDIFDTLHFMEIPWDEGPRDNESFENEYSQLHRLHLYNRALEHLRTTGQLFACECSRSDIERINPDGSYPGTCRDKKIGFDQPGVSWRLRTDHGTPVPATEWDGTIIRSPLPASMRDFIVRKKDGFPAYPLTSVVDDGYFGIDLIVRGTDLWPSTRAQLYLSQWLPDNPLGNTRFHHHRLLTGPAGAKLSKSTGATSIQFLRKEGQTRAGISSLIAKMMGPDEQIG